MAAAKKTETLTTKQVADAIGTTARELRVFLRASTDYQAVGAGKRYAFDTNDIGPMKTRFDVWRKARDEAKAAAKLVATKEEAPADDVTADQADATPEPAPKPAAKPSPRARKAANA
jgi:hypothetical protein